MFTAGWSIYAKRAHGRLPSPETLALEERQRRSAKRQTLLHAPTDTVQPLRKKHCRFAITDSKAAVILFGRKFKHQLNGSKVHGPPQYLDKG